MPPTPSADNIDAAVLKDCSASAESPGTLADVFELLEDDVDELLFVLDVEPLDEAAELDDVDGLEAGGMGLVGWKN